MQLNASFCSAASFLLVCAKQLVRCILKIVDVFRYVCPVYTGDKELKPASFRVREAAEGVLAYIMEQTVNIPRN